jgi:hypothetical protein
VLVGSEPNQLVDIVIRVLCSLSLVVISIVWVLARLKVGLVKLSPLLVIVRQAPFP